MEGEEQDKLAAARKRFEDALDHTVDAHAEAHRAEQFYHNTENSGQWDSDDLAYLRENDRPAFSFNIIKPKLDTFLGMYADAQRMPIVSAASSDDELLAEAIDAVKSEILQDAKFERLSARVLKTGTVAGECGLHVEVEPNDDGRNWIKINLYRILPFELHWDISSVEPDRSDARYVFWDRWLDKDEFQNAYPEYAQEWESLSKSGMAAEGYDEFMGHGEGGSVDWASGDDGYNQARWNRYYFDRQKNKVRVIRYEYKAFVEKVYVLDQMSGEKTEIERDQVERAELSIEMGKPWEIVKRKVEVTKVCEFVGAKILEEYDSAGPFDGFSIVPYCFAVDEETGTAYGFVRNLFDPQLELNKARSMDLEHLAQSVGVGVLAEEGQVPDEQRFMADVRTPGTVAFVARDALVEGRVRERQQSPPNQAAAVRAQAAIELANEISGIPSQAMLSPAEQAQAGMTVAIRYHKSRQTVTDPFGNFEDFVRSVVQKVVDAITRSMPDDQIAAVLANDSKYRVEGGVLYELGEHPEAQGQMVPVGQAALRDLRSSRWNLNMEFTSENSTLRMLEGDIFLQMMQAGVPVDPEVLVETATSNRSIRERLKRYVEQAQRAQQAATQHQQMLSLQQSQQFAEVEAMKVQETSRHNLASETLQEAKDRGAERLKALDLWEKADESEKARLLKMVELAEFRRREGMGGMNAYAG